ncbi:MAG: rod shape-determining protein MreC [Opitutales bacterium]|nr:rod shape-determining protein MreC [Opitutales bacterium]
MRDLGEYWDLSTRSRDELIIMCRDAWRIASSARVERQKLSRLDEENARLERLLALPSRPDIRVVPARIAQRNIGVWWQQIIIRCGRRDGVRVGCPVISASGVVGRVREVYFNTCVVELISSPSFRISAYIEGDDYPVTYQGAGISPSGNLLGQICDIPSDYPYEFAQKPIVSTTGIGGIFPAGLNLGRLSPEMRRSPNGLFFTAPVELQDSLSSIEEVAVLIPIRFEAEFR